LRVVGAVLVDAGVPYRRLGAAGRPLVRASEEVRPELEELERFEDCLECGLCLSAGPLAGAPRFLGPAALAAAERVLAEPRGADPAAILGWVDDAHGAWRCHAAFECSAGWPAGGGRGPTAGAPTRRRSWAGSTTPTGPGAAMRPSNARRSARPGSTRAAPSCACAGGCWPAGGHRGAVARARPAGAPPGHLGLCRQPPHRARPGRLPVPAPGHPEHPAARPPGLGRARQVVPRPGRPGL